MTETINERIARCRKLANLTQTETAEKMGMKCSTYSQMERKGSISTDRLLILAHIFNVSPNTLLFGTDIDSNDNKTTGNTLNLEPQNEIKPALSQSGDFYENKFKSAPFIVSHKEENILKILRNLPKSARDEVIEFINQKYQESKKK